MMGSHDDLNWPHEEQPFLVDSHVPIYIKDPDRGRHLQGRSARAKFNPVFELLMRHFGSPTWKWTLNNRKIIYGQRVPLPGRVGGALQVLFERGVTMPETEILLRRSEVVDCPQYEIPQWPQKMNRSNTPNQGFRLEVERDGNCLLGIFGVSWYPKDSGMMSPAQAQTVAVAI